MKRPIFVFFVFSSIALLIAVACAPAATPSASPTSVSTPTPATAATSPLQAAPTAAATSASSGGGGAKAIPADHVGRTQCLVCHLTGENGAPKLPSSPDHTAFKDDPAVCATCHQQGK